MDPSDPASFNHRVERLSTGRTYHFVDQIPEGYDPVRTPTLLCVHGFPDLWYGWRFVIAPWVEKCRWRVVVPDMLGYGGTDKPISPECYTPKSLGADLAALLDVIGVQQAVLIGHDWGAVTVWRFALWHPDRVRALVVLSIPFAPRRPSYLSLEEIVKHNPVFGYQLYFSDPSSTNDIESNLSAFMTTLFSRPTRYKNITSRENLQSFVTGETSRNVPTLLSEKELDYYLKNFRAGGMNGPLNYYRLTKLRFDEEEAGKIPTKLPASLPVLFLWGDLDPVCLAFQVERMHIHVPSVRVVRMPNIGHWLMVEDAGTVIDSVIQFVRNIWTEIDKPKL